MAPNCPRAAGRVPHSSESSGPPPPRPGLPDRERLPADRAVDVALRMRETLRVAQSVERRAPVARATGPSWLSRSPTRVATSRRSFGASARCADRTSIGDGGHRGRWRPEPPSRCSTTATHGPSGRGTTLGRPQRPTPCRHRTVEELTQTLRTAALAAPRVGGQGSRHGSALRISTLFGPYQHSSRQKKPAIVDVSDKI